MQEIEETSVVQSLQDMISNYMARNPSLTINSLAQRSNVPVTSLRRLMSGQQKNEIAPHSVLNLVSYILREKSLAILISRVAPSIALFLREHFGHFIFSSPKHTYDVDLNIELRDQTKYLIYKLAANHDGTDILTIVENFGALGKRKAEELLENGLLSEAGGRLHAREKNFTLDLDTAASHLPALVQFYRPESIQKGLNSMFSMSESLTAEAIHEIRTIQRECVLRISAVMNDPKNFGPIPYFTINLAETMAVESDSGGIH